MTSIEQTPSSSGTTGHQANHHDGGAAHLERMGNPVPLGLIGLSIASSALVPICFGYGLSPNGLKTAAALALFFGWGCQFLAGLMCYMNRNVFGGTLFTAFSFMWAFNAWSLHGLTEGVIPDPAIALAMDTTLLIVFLAFTYAHGFFSSVLFLFLVDITLVFVVRILKILTGFHAGDPILGVLTIAMIALALWICFGMLMNPLMGKAVFGVGKPIFKPQPPRS